MTDGTDLSLDNVAYLSRSENRVAILEALTESIPAPGRSRTGYAPRELKEMTGASEATVSRIVSEFEARGWCRRTIEGEYVATPKGKLVATEFDPFITAVETIDQLGDAAGLLPIPELTIGLKHFRDATIRRPMGFDPNEFGFYMNELMEKSSIYYYLTYVAPPQSMAETMSELIVSGQLDSVGVLAGSVVDYTSEHLISPGDLDHERQHLWTDEPGNTWYRFEGHLPCNLFIFDDLVVIENSQVEDIEPGTVIQSGNEAVWDWAMGVFEKYKDASERVERETFR
jgi:predicted transcriptional regulator